MAIEHISGVAGVLAVVLMGGCMDTDPAKEETNIGKKVVVKSPADDRDYRHIELENGLKALVISDPDTDKSAAAVDVKVGSFQDPDDRLGLAHFLEHMLFLGNEKYPKVDGYFEFIRANGGSANAYTANSRTNYYFDINSDQLESALDQLAQFFVSPTLDPAYVERERNAVDSEYRLHAKEDSWRLLMAQNALSNPAHPKSRFTIGSLETLKNDSDNPTALWEDVRAFYERYYVAENMSVVVYGKESVDELESWVRSSFEGVPERESPSVNIGVEPYTQKELGVRINLVPLKDTRVLSLNFPLPSQSELYRKKPLGYISRILGYEGKGSLYSYLRDQGLIESLTVQSLNVPNEYSEMGVRMELTQTGLEQVDEITSVVFDFIAMIKEQGLKAWMYDETRQVAELGFRYQEDESPQQTASYLASRMHFLPAEDILQAAYLYEEYDPDMIQQLLDKMVPDNLRLVVIARELDTDQLEPWFDTQYSVSPLEESLIQRLQTPEKHEGLVLPEANTFLAKNLDMQEEEKPDAPQLLLDKPGLELWSMTDSSFGVPRANVYTRISTPRASATAKDYLLLHLYREMLLRDLNEYGYPAREAGLYYNISAGREGLVIALSGYQDKQSVLLKGILDTARQFEPDALIFSQEQDRLIRKIRNKKFQPPYKLGTDRLSQVLYPNHPEDAELLAAAEEVTLKDLQAFLPEFYKSIHIEMLVHGNHSATTAKELASQVERSLLTKANRRDAYRQPFKTLKDDTEQVELSVDHNDSLYIRYHQRPSTSDRERAVYSLLGRLLATPFFNQLRTEQQLGYIVFAGARPMERHPGLIFVVQSPVADPDEISERVDAFLKNQQQRFKTLDNSELEQYRQGLIGDLLKKDDNLDERSARFWQALEDHEEGFDYRKRIAEAVRKVTTEDIHKALDTIMTPSGSVVLKSVGQAHQQDEEKTAE